MSSIINKVKDVLHGDSHSNTSGTTTTGNTTTTHGTHSGVPEGTAGPHNSRVANTVDPRIDSDLDGRATQGNSGLTGTTHNQGNAGLTGTTHHHHQGHSGLTGTSQNTGYTGTTGNSGVTGPTGNVSGVSGSGYNNTTGTEPVHSSNLLNKLDPRVDSTAVNSSSTYGAGQTGQTGTAGSGYNTTTGNHSNLTGTGHHHSGHHTTAGNSGVTGTGYNTTTGNNSGLTGAGYDNTTGTGPVHSSNLANKLDPRVDSSATYGAGQSGTTGTHGTHGTHSGVTGSGYNTTTTGDRGGLSNSTNAGPHNSNVANKLDPRVDSDLDSTGNRHGTHHGGLMGSGTHATAGSGTAQNTQGPHNSDLMNKLDPRVDADGDGSRTYGGNKTHA
jgi:hypothetical protein